MTATERQLSIHLYRVRFTDVCEGEFVDPMSDDEVVPVELCEGESAVEECVKQLRNLGLRGCDSQWSAGVWFAYPDGSIIVNYATDEREELTAHLEGFTDDEHRDIWHSLSR